MSDQNNGVPEGESREVQSPLPNTAGIPSGEKETIPLPATGAGETAPLPTNGSPDGNPYIGMNGAVPDQGQVPQQSYAAQDYSAQGYEQGGYGTEHYSAQGEYSQEQYLPQDAQYSAQAEQYSAQPAQYGAQQQGDYGQYAGGDAAVGVQATAQPGQYGAQQGQYGAQQGQYPAAAGAYGAGQPGVPVMAAPNPIVEHLKTIFTAQGLTTLGLLVAATFIPALIGAVLWFVPLSMTEGAQLPSSVLLTLMGIVLGGSLSVAVASFSFPHLGILALVGFFSYLVVRQRHRADVHVTSRKILGARAAAEGGIVALIAAIFSAIFISDLSGIKIEIGYGEVSLAALQNLSGLLGLPTLDLNLRPNILFVFLYVFIAVAWGSYAARMRNTQQRAFPGKFGDVIAETLAAHRPLFLVFIPIALVGAIIFGIQNDMAGGFVAALPFLPNGAIVLAGLAYLGGWSATVRQLKEIPFSDSSAVPATSQEGFAWALGWPSILLFIAGIIVLFAAACAIGVARPRSATPDWGRVWQTPLVILVLWYIVGVGLSGIRANLYIMEINAGMSWWTPITVALAMLAASALAEILPARLAASAPGLLTIFAGRRNAAAWFAGGAGASAALAPEYVTAADGTVSAVPAPPPPPGAPVPGAPLDPKTKKIVILAGVLVLILTLAGIAVAVVINVLNGQRTPAAPVEEYLGLISQGKATEATALVDPGIANAERVLLTNEAMGQATARIENYSVKVPDNVDVNKPVEVEVEYSLDGEKHTGKLTVSPGPKEFGVLNTWKVSTPLLSKVDIHAQGLDSVSIAGVNVPVKSEDNVTGSTVSIPAYPGIYPVKGPDMGQYVSVKEGSAKATTASNEYGALPTANDVELKVEYTQALHDLILEKAKEKAQACVTPPTNMDEGCPMAVQNRELAKMELVEGPTKVELIGDRFTTNDVTMVIQRNPSTFNRNPKDEKFTPNVSGTVDLTDPKNPKIEVRVGGY
ncbi:MAG: hypothetical protein Q4C87_12650 [Actinomycetaceae bacterium]|nr:hypothetical protein [Actinomycetaceae bacterium]